MFNFNINKTNNHLSQQITEHKKDNDIIHILAYSRYKMWQVSISLSFLKRMTASWLIVCFVDIG
jgi:hypothetical protein